MLLVDKNIISDSNLFFYLYNFSQSTTFEYNSFLDCKNLKSIEINKNNNKYKSIDGVLFTKDGKTLITYPASKEESSYIIPIDVEEIEFDAFLES